MKMKCESDIDPVRVKLEIDESAGELDIAREKFETALQELLYKEEASDSDAEEQQQQLQRAQDIAQGLTQTCIEGSTSAEGPTPSSRPPRKRRRKDPDNLQSSTGAGVGSGHGSFVVKMFDRSVDLAQFSAHSPLYPICRAWLLNEPHQIAGDSLLLPPSPSSPSQGADLPEIHFLPVPDPLPSGGNPYIPPPVRPTQFTPKDASTSSSPPPSELLLHHVQHWREVRQTWRRAGAVADARYESSANVLRGMFRTHNGSGTEHTSSQQSVQ